MRNMTIRGAGMALLIAGCLTSGACGNSGGTPYNYVAPGSGSSSSSGGSGSGGNNGTPGSSSGSPGSSGGSGSSSGGGNSAIDAGGVTVTATNWDVKTATDAARKVKNLLVGMPPTDADVMLLTQQGPAGMQQLIDSWMTDPTTLPFFKSKMLFFFRNMFQQTGFTPTVDFMPQLLANGGFDFGPFGVSAVGDDSFQGLVENLQDEFAMTAWQLVQEGHPFIETLTTQRYMMTTGLKMVYLQIEMPNDQPYSFGQKQQKISWSIDYSGNPIALEDAIKNMVFSDEPPAHAAGGIFGGGMNAQFPTCRGSTTTPTGTFTGYAQLFQRIIGYTPRYPFAAQPTCWEHPSKPYLTTADVNDWQWVTVAQKGASDAYIQPYDLPTLRTTTTLKLALPRVGFYTTPAFLAIWNTNDSNQHRVTANQTLLAALGESFTSDSTIIPINAAGLDSAHTTTSGACYGCHKSLDPMRNFWANQLDFNDRNDWLTSTFNGAVPNPKPAAAGGTFAFADVNMAGASILDFGTLLGKVTDGDATSPLNQFAIAVTQKLCYFANSNPCDTTDPEFRRVVAAFANGFNFPTLIKELFASPLITGATDTKSWAKQSVPVSIVRRDHFCQALSNRLGISDICAQAVTLPTTAQTATATIAGGLVADAFSRGSPTPVTPPDPNLFYRAAVEQLCQAIAPQVVDATSNTVWSSSGGTANVTSAISDMVSRIMGYPPSDSHYAMAVSILQSHMTSAQQQSNASTALRSTFVLACESPTSVGVGL